VRLAASWEALKDKPCPFVAPVVETAPDEPLAPLRERSDLRVVFFVESDDPFSPVIIGFKG
jgi:hypothetical protein